MHDDWFGEGVVTWPAGGGARCPLCRREGFEVIAYGLPARLCSSPGCSCFWAHWSIEWLLTRLPHDGEFFRYENCYWAALWAWLRGRDA